MVLFNYSTKELTAKIVYYGPGLCGKTTNLQYIFENLPASINKGKMLSLATQTDRTLFFDFLPIDLGTIRNMKTRLQLYTVPGQVFYNTTRKLVLKGADGLIFVADSQRKMLDANIESFKNLEENLREHGMNLADLPHILQFNKRDLADLLSPDELNSRLNKFNAPIYESVATTGIGVQDTLKAVTRLVLNSLKEKYGDGKKPGDRRPRPAAKTPAPALAPAAAVAAAPAAAENVTADPVLEISEEQLEEPVLSVAEEADVPVAAEVSGPVAATVEGPPVLEVAEEEEAEIEVIEDASPLQVEMVEPEVALDATPEEAVEIVTEDEPLAPDVTSEIEVDAEPSPVEASGPIEVVEEISVADEPSVTDSSPLPEISLGVEAPVSAREPSASETTFPIAVDINGQTVHLKVTITLRVEQS
jgi:signal recognition particle receptor subunit beta